MPAPKFAKNMELAKNAPDAVDFAFEKFRQIVTDVAAYAATIETETDTRLKVIDRILIEVLGWTRDSIKTSEQAGTGFVDYVIRINGSSRLVLEAKKDGLSFELGARQSAQAYKLNGAVFKGAALAAIEQAIRYNAYKNAELACTTNGREWIIFRANRLGDGQDTMEGKAFMFASLEEIQKNFTTFYDLLSFDSVRTLKYRGLFQESEGIPLRDLSFLKCIRPPESRHLLPPGEFSADFNAIMSSFFHRLKGDEDADMIITCLTKTHSGVKCQSIGILQVRKVCDDG